MSESRKISAILVSDVVGYSRLAGADEVRTLARLRGLRSDLVDPAVDAHRGRVVKSTGDGALIEFRSVVDAVRCAIEVQSGMSERNVGVPPERRIDFRIGIHLGDVVEESDGDLMGDGVNIAARLEGMARPGAICLSEDAYRQVRSRLNLAVADLGPTRLKNIAEPIRVYSLEVGKRARPHQIIPAQGARPLRGAGWIAAAIMVACGAAWLFVAGPQLRTSAAAVASFAPAPSAPPAASAPSQVVDISPTAPEPTIPVADVPPMTDAQERASPAPSGHKVHRASIAATRASAPPPPPPATTDGPPANAAPAIFDGAWRTQRGRYGP
jgi:class 3 adenylate cyclase